MVVPSLYLGMALYDQNKNVSSVKSHNDAALRVGILTALNLNRAMDAWKYLKAKDEPDFLGVFKDHAISMCLCTVPSLASNLRSVAFGQIAPGLQTFAVIAS